MRGKHIGSKLKKLIQENKFCKQIISSSFQQDGVTINDLLEVGDMNSPVRNSEFAQFTVIYFFLTLFN